MDMIWDDLYETHTGWVANMPFFRRFRHEDVPYIGGTRALSSTNHNLVWFEIEEGGEGNNYCQPSTNATTNTVIEIVWTRMYYLMNDDSWVLAGETKDQLINGNGGTHPHGSSYIWWDKDHCAITHTMTFK